jgi:Holliday junction resolvase RusA-like endonuclease
MSIKSEEALSYAESFLIQIPRKARICIDVPVKVSVIAYYSSRRPDLDCELIFDCLEKGGVLKNDRLIHHKDMMKGLDKENPRAEIRIEVIG